MTFPRIVSAAVVVAGGLFVSLAPAQDSKFSVRTIDLAPPKELSEEVQKLLGNKAVQLVDSSGKTACDLWVRLAIPVDATAEQIKNGLTYKEVKQTEIIGAIRFDQDWRDYRKQKVKAGVYTLRLGFQPADGDHAGSSEFQDFLVATHAAKDQKAAVVEVKHMIEESAKSIDTGHPAVFMLFPINKPAANPELQARPKSHWVLSIPAETSAAGKKTGAVLGFGITLLGAAD